MLREIREAHANDISMSTGGKGNKFLGFYVRVNDNGQSKQVAEGWHGAEFASGKQIVQFNFRCEADGMKSQDPPDVGKIDVTIGRHYSHATALVTEVNNRFGKAVGWCTICGRHLPGGEGGWMNRV